MGWFHELSSISGFLLMVSEGNSFREREMDVVEEVKAALEMHPAFKSVRLVGSRQRGDAIELSDWDFEVEVTDFPTFARALPVIVAPLQPISQMWDPYSGHPNYCLMLRGARKVDLLFHDHHQQKAPPWTVHKETLPTIDSHFWDWILWIASKHLAHKHELVGSELQKIASQLLGPMKVTETPESIEAAVALYRAARQRLEVQLDVRVGKELETEVLQALQRVGYSVSSPEPPSD